jgi:hypothetical protein
MALSFLNKKIWHPGSFANMEKTWVTEQKYREVERRAIEKAKKIKEEKVYEEMKKIQVEKGLIPAYHLHRLDFMYQCPQPEKAENKDENEDFLLGKRLDDDNEDNYMKRKKKIVPKFANTYANPQNEEFVRIHEDPLYLILKEEKKQRKEIEQNPYKMKEILNELKNDLNKNDNNNIKLDESEEETEKYNEEDDNTNGKKRKNEEINYHSSHRHHHKSHKKHHHHSSHKYKSKDKHKNSHHHHH